MTLAAGGGWLVCGAGALGASLLVCVLSVDTNLSGGDLAHSCVKSQLSTCWVPSKTQSLPSRLLQ